MGPMLVDFLLCCAITECLLALVESAKFKLSTLIRERAPLSEETSSNLEITVFSFPLDLN